MNIAIDLTAIPKSKAGVGRYLINLIRYLQEIDKENSYYLFVQDDDKDDFKLFNSNFRLILVHSKLMRNIPVRLLWEQFILPSKLSKLKINLLHSPHYTMPYLGKVKKVVTFHDMTYFVIPEMHTFLKRWLFKLYINLSAKKADGRLVVSQATADDMTKILKVNDDNIYVTPLGVDESFFEQDEIDKGILKSYGIDSEYFLYVGTIEPRKNILRMLKAYSSLDENIKDRYKLVISGKKGWMFEDIFKFIEANKLENNVIFTGFVKDEYLPIIYKGAKLFLYVSIYEGFGIPIAEAMASGVPCITSDLSSMKEVAGDACCKIDPYNEEQIKESIIELLKDESLYDMLKKKGINRAKNYTWIECAKKTLEAYKKILMKCSNK